MIKSMWMTCFPEASRWLLLRIYWDGGSSLGRGSVREISLQRLDTPTFVASLPINVNPAGGYNCYFPMPFGKAPGLR